MVEGKDRLAKVVLQHPCVCVLQYMCTYTSAPTHPHESLHRHNKLQFLKTQSQLLHFEVKLNSHGLKSISKDSHGYMLIYRDVSTTDIEGWMVARDGEGRQVGLQYSVHHRFNSSLDLYPLQHTRGMISQKECFLRGKIIGRPSPSLKYLPSMVKTISSIPRTTGKEKKSFQQFFCFEGGRAVSLFL